jgi:hypothetical protein
MPSIKQRQGIKPMTNKTSGLRIAAAAALIASMASLSACGPTPYSRTTTSEQTTTTTPAPVVSTTTTTTEQNTQHQ